MWPGEPKDGPTYIHTHTHIRTRTQPPSQVPDIITANCPRVAGGAQGWIYDPFQHTLKPEYYNCEKLVNQDGDEDAVPFVVPGDAGGGRMVESAFHFDKAWWGYVSMCVCMVYMCVSIYMYVHEADVWWRAPFISTRHGRPTCLCVYVCVYVCMYMRQTYGGERLSFQQRTVR